MPTPPVFDVRDPAFIANPYPAYRFLRANAPVWKSPVGRWFLTRHEDAATMLRDRRFAKDMTDPAQLMRRFGPTAMEEPSVVEFSHMMLLRDPPDHTRLRGLVSRAFAARRVEEMRTHIRGMVDKILTRAIPEGGMDVMRDLAFPVPMLVICELLGIPEEDRAGFVHKPAAGAALLNPTPPTRAELDTANAGTLASTAYFEALFERRRREPGDDLISLMVQAEETGDRLSAEELRANVVLLFAAGHETTVNLIGNGVLSLQRHPDQWQALRDDPGSIPNAIEEILRYESPVQAVSRTVMEPLEMSGVALDKGDVLVALVGAVNRDPDVYTDPDRLDVTRKDARMLSFGGGIHFCLGAQLARIEAEVVFEELVRRIPDMRLPEIDAPQWRDNFTLRGLKTLPAVWN
jgi:cytochrome P450